MSRTKNELYEENRALRNILGDFYDRASDYLEPDDEDLGEGSDDAEHDDAENDDAEDD